MAIFHSYVTNYQVNKKHISSHIFGEAHHPELRRNWETVGGCSADSSGIDKFSPESFVLKPAHEFSLHTMQEVYGSGLETTRWNQC